ncbi:homocysteine S-methyltransferase family protein [Daejeonella sp.]|uniref:homocysteine S-methyltransferase family protein n=1 Tax=Daejeonella sp. TaxID=2805397 RepID=UPI0030BF6BE7
MLHSKTILPNASANLFLTDGGLETTLIFHEGYDLPYFAAFDLLKDEKGYNSIRDYYRRYLNIAKEFKTGFILESPTWRASSDWIEKMGYSNSAVAEVNQKAIQLLAELKEEFKDYLPSIVISGCVGPRGDGYKPGHIMTASEAREYHSTQIKVFADARVDMVAAITMNYAEEAIGIVHAANDLNLPVVISFTVETNGKLPSGPGLKEAIEKVDKSVKTPPIYYMLNCAYPTHFMEELQDGIEERWTERIKGIRANASCKSHAELDEAIELDRGNPQELGRENKRLKEKFSHLNVFGGCCGTDEEHIFEIIKQMTSSAAL